MCTGGENSGTAENNPFKIIFLALIHFTFLIAISQYKYIRIALTKYLNIK